MNKLLWRFWRNGLQAEANSLSPGTPSLKSYMTLNSALWPERLRLSNILKIDLPKLPNVQIKILVMFVRNIQIREVMEKYLLEILKSSDVKILKKQSVLLYQLTQIQSRGFNCGDTKFNDSEVLGQELQGQANHASGELETSGAIDQANEACSEIGRTKDRASNACSEIGRTKNRASDACSEIGRSEMSMVLIEDEYLD